MKRILIVVLGLWGCLGGLLQAAAGEDSQARSLSPADADWQLSGDAGFDDAVVQGGKRALRVGAGGFAFCQLREQDGGGVVCIRVREDMKVAAEVKAKRAGPRWGVVRNDGRVLMVGVLYAPYLAGDKTYAAVASDQKEWFRQIQYLPESRSAEWSEWRFAFDSAAGVSISRNGVVIERFKGEQTQMSGFRGILLLGDSGKENPGTVWAVVPEVSLVTALAGSPKDALLPKTDPAAERVAPLQKEALSQHPRLLFGKSDLPAMKEWLRTEDGAKALEKIKSYLANSKPTEDTRYLTDATDAQRQGLWKAPTAGMHYLLTGDASSKEAAIGFMKMFLKQNHWETTEEQDSGMSAANIAIGAALLYDWLYDDLEPTFRKQYRDKLLLMARRIYYLGHLNLQHAVGYWQEDPINNHRWHANAGLALCVLAAAEEGNPDTEWLTGKLADDLDFVTRWLSADGSTHEGPNYMIFGLGHLVLAMQAADRCLGTRYLSNSFFRNVPGFLVSTTQPGFRGFLSYADCPSNSDTGNYTNVLYYCAALAGNADLVSAVRQIEASSPRSFWIGWMDLVWKRPASALQGDYQRLPVHAFLDDIGLVNLRESWAASSAALMFKCGPFGGYSLNRFRNENGFKYINVGHDDFDANSFVLFHDGAITAATDGYSVRKRSSNHNTILVNGSGQLVPGRLKEGVEWNQPSNGDMTAMAMVTTYRDDGDLVVVEGEAAGSYPALTKDAPRPALEQYRRSMIWVAGKYLLVLDAIRAADPAEITWMMQGKKMEMLKESEGCFRISAEKVACDFQTLCTLPLTVKIVPSTADDHGKSLGLQQLQLRAKGEAMRFASVFDPWGKKDLRLTMSQDDAKTATVRVRGAGINDVWRWTLPVGRFVPSLLNAEVAGKTVIVGERDVAKHP